MQQQYPFQPRGASGNPPAAQASIAVTTAVQQLTLPQLPSEGGTMRVVVDGTSNIAWTFGVAAGLTMNNGVPMLGNTVESFSIPASVTQLSVIGAATGSTLRVVVGDGQ
jgi:hypothetical protein